MKIAPLGHALSLFFVITFLLCVLWGLFTPMQMHMHSAWEKAMPGFHWISVPSFFVGLAWAYGYGWYIAVIFTPLYNFFDRRVTP